MLQRSYYVFALALALGLFLSCSSNDNPTSPPVMQNIVAAQDDIFSPATITITAGTTVTWTNTGINTHSVTSGSPTSNSGAIFDSGSLIPGEQFQRSFPQTGQFPYYCRFHGTHMSGTVIVQ